MANKTIMSADDIRRTLARIAHEIIERNRNLDNLIMVGIHTRGVPLAQRLAQNIASFESTVIPVGALDISHHRDDLALLTEKPMVKNTSIPANIDGKSVILVDDVLYTGRSIRAAMDALIEYGRPQSIQLTVLVDRGHREMPIRPDYVGRNIPSSRSELVQVYLKESDGLDEVIITSSKNAEKEDATTNLVRKG